MLVKTRKHYQLLCYYSVGVQLGHLKFRSHPKTFRYKPPRHRYSPIGTPSPKKVVELDPFCPSGHFNSLIWTQANVMTQQTTFEACLWTPYVTVWPEVRCHSQGKQTASTSRRKTYHTSSQWHEVLSGWAPQACCQQLDRCRRLRSEAFEYTYRKGAGYWWYICFCSPASVQTLHGDRR